MPPKPKLSTFDVSTLTEFPTLTSIKAADDICTQIVNSSPDGKIEKEVLYKYLELFRKKYDTAEAAADLDPTKALDITFVKAIIQYTEDFKLHKGVEIKIDEGKGDDFVFFLQYSAMQLLRLFLASALNLNIAQKDHPDIYKMARINLADYSLSMAANPLILGVCSELPEFLDRQNPYLDQSF